MVSISACHADDPGSIPGRGTFFRTLLTSGPVPHSLWGTEYLRREDRRDVVVGSDEGETDVVVAALQGRLGGVVQIQNVLDVLPGGGELHEVLNQRSVRVEGARGSARDLLEPEVRGGVAAVTWSGLSSEPIVWERNSLPPHVQKPPPDPPDTHLPPPGPTLS